MFRKAAILVVLGALLAVPVFAQGLPAFFLAIDQNGTMPSGVIEIATPATIPFWTQLTWPGHENEQFRVGEVSFHYEIWGTGQPGVFNVTQIASPGDSYTVGEWWKFAQVYTDKPNCTYIRVKADMGIAGCVGIIESNTLTFHLNDPVPEPGSLLALGTGLMGMAGFVIRRRR